MAMLPAEAWAAARVQLRVSAQQLTVEDELTVQLTASGDYDEVGEMVSDGFDFRQTGHQQQMSIIGMTASRQEVWTWVGTPRRPGQYALGPIVLKSDGAVVAQTQAVRVEVRGEAGAVNVPAMPAQEAMSLQTYAGQVAFVRPVLSTPSPVAGQPFVLSFELFWSQQAPVQGIRETVAPKWGDLDVDDLQAGQQPKQMNVMVGNRPYAKQTTHHVLVTAAKPGKLRLDGPGYRVQVADVFEERVLKVVAHPLEIDVRPVPTSGRPAAFRPGDVGKLALSGTLTRPDKGALADTRTGERLLLVYQVAGEGNLLGMSPIRPPDTPGIAWEPLAGRSDQGVKKTDAGVQGTRVWQYVGTVERAGQWTVPVVELAAFDPERSQFVTTRAGPFEVTAQGAADVAPTQASPSADATTGGPRRAAEVLRPLVVDAALSTQNAQPWPRQPWFWPLALAPWPLAGLLGLGRWWRRRRQAGASGRERALALQQARLRLDAAVASGPDTGYSAIREAVVQYVQLAAGVAAGGLSERSLTSALQAAGATPELAQSLLVELQHCDYARFAPGGERGADLAESARRVVQVLEQLDRSWQVVASAPVNESVGKVALGVVLCLGLAGAVPPALATTLDQTFAAGNQAYVAGQFAQAQRTYEQLLQHARLAPAIHANLAKTLVHLGQLGRAIGHFELALRASPPPALRDDIAADLQAVRAELADRARRQHATLHVFDEAPEASVALARAAPESLLGVLAVLGGVTGLVTLAWRRRVGWRWPLFGLGLSLHVVALAWLMMAAHVRQSVHHAVVVEEDAHLQACQGVGEPMGLPEGLVVRRLASLPDGRVEVRLPNGREGCLTAATLVVLE
jgi:hypothetical protein